MLRRLGCAVFGGALVAASGCHNRGNVGVSVGGVNNEIGSDGLTSDLFSDGWWVTFEHFVVKIGPVTLDSETLVDGPVILDLVQGNEEIADLMLPEGPYQALSFRIAPDGEADKSRVSDFAAMLLEDGGYSVYVAGKAMRGDQTVGFAWGFAAATAYACEANADVRRDNGQALPIVIRADHLFFNDLEGEPPKLAFDAIAAADADADGEVTEAELRAVAIGTLGGYQVGSTGVADLWSFIEHQSTRIGHYSQDVHCEATRE